MLRNFVLQFCTFIFKLSENIMFFSHFLLNFLNFSIFHIDLPFFITETSLFESIFLEKLLFLSTDIEINLNFPSFNKNSG